ncbi:MAG: glycosyltransferase family 39 protein [Clostridiales bacterium]|nr:glycosyltransferase family 39 protein [Clostridiales bacterium]
MIEKRKNKEYIYILLWGHFTGVMFIWSFLVCRIDCVTYDNSYQYYLNLHSWKEMLGLVLQDYSPPLYSVLLKLFSVVFGCDLLSLRLLSSFLFSILFYFLFFPLRRLMGQGCAVMAAFLFLTSSYNFYFGFTIRPSVLAYVLTTGLFIYALLAFFGDGIKDYCFFTLLSLMCMYTHNVSLIAAFCTYLTLIVASIIVKRRAAIKFLISGIIVSVLYIPWLMVLLRQAGAASDHFWVGKSSLINAFYIVFIGMTHNYPILVISSFTRLAIIILPFICVLIVLFKYNKNNSSDIKDEFPNLQKVILLTIVIALTIMLFYLITRSVVSIFADRYYYVLSGGGIIIVSGFVTLCKNNKFAVIIISGLVSITFILNTISQISYNYACKRDDMLADLQLASEGDISFIHFHENAFGLSAYYFPDAHHYVTDDTFTVLNNYDVFDVDRRSLHHADEIWDYTDRCFIFTSVDFDSIDISIYDYCEYYFDNPESFNIEKIGDYQLSYDNEVGYGTNYVYVYQLSKLN